MTPTLNVRSRERRVSPPSSKDFFVTPPGATQALLEREVFPGVIWECACGNGAISKVLQGEGYRVRSTDLVDRGYGSGGEDFLASTTIGGAESIVTNPPFNLATQFAQHALDLGARKVALLCRTAFLEGQERGAGIFADGRLSRVWTFSKRITLWRGDDPNPKDTGGAMSFSWFVWEKFQRGTVVGWIR